MKNLNILFVGGSKRNSFAENLIDAGGKNKFHINLYSYEMGSRLPIEDIATVIQGVSFESSKVINDIENVINKYKIDIAIPFHDKAIHLLKVHSSKVFTPISEKYLIDIFSSKIKTTKFLREMGVLVPSFSGNVPSIAKPDKGSSSKGILKFYKQYDLDYFINSGKEKNYEIQDLLSGPEYTVDCYVSLNGDFKHFAVRERLEVLGGEVVKSKTVDIPYIEKICSNIINIPGMVGAITIQFIYDDRSKKYYVMEINLRYGGGILTSWGAGVPWFDILLYDYMKKNHPIVKHKSNFYMTRSFREYFYE
jgi:carbamoyl-phosphate synthase large subunit